jgi:uncharacterized protein with LGFP repeats
VRTRGASSGQWSGWRSVEAHTTDAPDSREAKAPKRRGGTQGLWVGPSNGVEVRVTGQGRTLPDGLRVELIDPGRNTSSTVEGSPKPRAASAGTAEDSDRSVGLAAAAQPIQSPSPETTPSGTPSASPSPSETSPSASPSVSPSTSAPAPSPSASPSTSAPPLKLSAVTAPKPAIVSRAGWSADESLVKAPPTYDTTVKAAFVHHSATGNSYTCAEAPAVVRSVFLYHVQSQGWDDIGYNFLVDKCGTLYEGRAGGVDRAVHGAHTYGFNTDTTGIAVLGTHTAATDPSTPGVAPTQAALDAVAKVAAWKLGLTGVDPTAKTILTSAAPNGTGGKYPYGQQVEFNTISGHRDGFATACPGEQLYAKLGTIRTAAKQLTTPALAAKLTGANLVGGRYYTASTVTIGWTPSESATYEVRVDGAVAAKPAAGASSATVTLTPGTHTVKLRAVNADGTTAESPAFTVVADTTKPVFGTPPQLLLRRAVVAATSIPVTLTWKATDNSLLTGLQATSPSAQTFTVGTTLWNATAKPATAQTWSLTARDAVGNTATSGITRTGAYISEFSGSRTAGWRSTTGTAYLGGKVLYSGTRNHSVTFTFTGRTAGLIFKRASNTGAAVIYVDGVNVGTLDTRSSTTAYRALIWTRAWSTSAKHTIKVVVAGTSGRPTVWLDGFAYIR